MYVLFAVVLPQSPARSSLNFAVLPLSIRLEMMPFLHNHYLVHVSQFSKNTLNRGNTQTGSLPPDMIRRTGALRPPPLPT